MATFSLEFRAKAERERRKRALVSRYNAPSVFEFMRRTKIETQHIPNRPLSPFIPWEAQEEVLKAFLEHDKIVLLKARQLGISWLSCGFGLWMAQSAPRRTILALSQGQTEASELVRRTGDVLMRESSDYGKMSPVTRDNLTRLDFASGSRVISLAATRRAGRSFTASLVLLDEYAFMQWNERIMGAIKPTTDNGGKMIVVSTADGNGTHFHQFWRRAKLGQSEFHPIFLPWHVHPDRDAGWRDRLLEKSDNPSDVYREYPATDVEAFRHASGLVYEGVWDESESVTEEADYIPSGGEVYWAVDDGYTGKLDSVTGYYTPDSHPRVILFCQLRANGRLVVFDEMYRIKTLSDNHINEALDMPYPVPELAAVDKSAAELKGRLREAGIFTRNSPSSVGESIKHQRSWFAADENGWRRILVHPRCHHLRGDLMMYKNGDSGKPIKEYDHGPDALRYLSWVLRGS